MAALQRLHGLCHRCQDDDQLVMSAAAQGGQLKVLKHLRARPNPVPWHDSILLSAASHADCLAWLLVQEEPCPCCQQILDEIAEAGNLPALQHLRLHHNTYVPIEDWDGGVCYGDAKGGHLFILQWARRQVPPVPWDESVCRAAAARGDVAMIKWARSQDPPAPWGSSVRAAATRDLITLQWLLDQTPACPLHPDCPVGAARRGDLPMLQLLSSLGCIASDRLYREAAEHGHVHILRWLHQHQMSAKYYVPPSGAAKPLSTPMLMFLGDVGAYLYPQQQALLILARKTCCTFYGLLRWCCRAMPDTSKGVHHAFHTYLPDASGRDLLVRLSLLPVEIVNRIALAAGIQHNLFQESDADDHLYPQPN